MVRRVGLNGHSFVRLTIHPNKFSTFFPKPGSSAALIGAKLARLQGHFCGETGSPIWTPACRRPGPSVRASGSLAHLVAERAH